MNSKEVRIPIKSLGRFSGRLSPFLLDPRLAELVRLEDSTRSDLESRQPATPAAVGVDHLQEAQVQRFPAGLRGMAGDDGLARIMRPHLLRLDELPLKRGV